ncbi:MAG: DUF3267 domain-containing protein [Bacteroidota bacterium]
MTIQSLQNNPSYSLLLVLPHNDILPFISKYLNAKTAVMRFYFGFLVAVSLGMILWAAWDIEQGSIGFWQLLKYFMLGAVPVFLLLIPLHEGLHGLAYLFVGAKKISFGANLRMFYFYAVADRYIARRNDFIFVAILPFLVVSAIACISMFFVPVHWKWMFVGVLFIHTTACAGDFAMLGFYESYRHAKDLLTYDDVREKRSYFYVRE